MNYTNPNRKTDDKPEDFMYTSLAFAQALNFIMEDGTGLVVEVKGDLLKLKPDITKVIVLRNDKLISIENISDNTELKHGNWVKLKK